MGLRKCAQYLNFLRDEAVNIFAAAVTPHLTVMVYQPNVKFEDNISTNVSDFPNMVRNFTLVDKTYAIRDFVCDGSPMHLILRPRRSGKSLFLSMMR